MVTPVVAVLPGRLSDPATFVTVVELVIAVLLVMQIVSIVLVVRSNRAYRSLASAASTAGPVALVQRPAERQFARAVVSRALPVADLPGMTTRTDRMPPPMVPRGQIGVAPVVAVRAEPRFVGFDLDAEYGDAPVAARPVAQSPAVPRRAPGARQGFGSIEEMAVSAVVDGGRAIAQVAQTFRVSPALVSYWVAKSRQSRVG